MWSLDVSQLYGPPQPVTGIALPFYLLSLRLNSKSISHQDGSCEQSGLGKESFGLNLCLEETEENHGKPGNNI
jgi:hypothetical protein